MAKYTKSIDEIIGEMTGWEESLYLIRDIALSLDMEEGVKWGMPVYMVDGKNVLGMGSFKNHACIWFFNGAFLSDPHKVLVNAGEGRTRGLRQWRFATPKEVKPAWIKKYMKEAIENQKAGKMIRPQRKEELPIPEEYEKAFRKNKGLKAAFQQLSPGKRREYIEYVTEAKTEATRLRRTEKTLPMIFEGKGLNDVYK